MTGKLKTWEKIVEIISLLLIVAAGIFKAVSGDVDGGLLGVLIFIGIMLFVIFLVAALFPATWRMTKRQKEKIDDEAKYQDTSNTVTVKPEKPEIEKYVNEAVHKDITLDEEFTYDIVAYVSKYFKCTDSFGC